MDSNEIQMYTLSQNIIKLRHQAHSVITQDKTSQCLVFVGSLNITMLHLYRHKKIREQSELA